MLSGKTALVVGGSRGIGRAISLRLGAEGAAVTFRDRVRAWVPEVLRAPWPARGPLGRPNRSTH